MTANMKIPKKRLTILSNSEIIDLYSLPVFDEAMREFYFTLEDSEITEMKSKKLIESRVNFILQLGYFKYKEMFFRATFADVRDDVQYIMNRYFSNEKLPEVMISKKTRLDHQSRILKLLQYKLFNSNDQAVLKKHLLKETRLCIDPKDLFDKTLTFLNEQRIAIPGYSTLQDIIGQVLTQEDVRLQSIINEHLQESADAILRKMLMSNSQKMYGITILKRDAKSFNYQEVMQEVNKKQMSESLFKVAETIIPKLDISEENIRYYAYLVDYYTVDRLKELSYEKVRLYLLCYIFYRFEKINDNLINSFFYRINLYKNGAKQDSKNKVYEQKLEANHYTKEIKKILNLFPDETVPDNSLRAKGFEIVEKEKFPLLISSLSSQTFDEENFKWSYYKTIAKTISKNLRPLVRVLDFEGEDHHLMEAIAFLKATFNGKKSLKQIKENKFPTRFIPSSLKSYLYEAIENEGQSEKNLNVYQYEFLVYYQLERALDTGRIFVNNSLSFKSLKKDLLENWDVDKKEILTNLNNPVLNMSIQEQLDHFKQESNALFLQVNQNIESGKNKDVKIKIAKNDQKTKAVPAEIHNLRSELSFKTNIDEPNEKKASSGSTRKDEKIKANTKDNKAKQWTLSYPANESEINNPFYEQFPKVSLNQVLRLVNQHSHFMEAFTHVKSRYSKTKADEDAIMACTTAIATNAGLYLMSGMSDISYNTLFATFKNFVRLESLRNASDMLADTISELPIFKHWDLLEALSVSSLDGKKFLVRLNHIMARHSSKYFGTKKGIVSFSMIVNNFCTSSKAISPNEHESHHFYHLTDQNTSVIQANWHCGDTHSINNVNPSLYHLLGQGFTPHIKNITQKAEGLFSFEDPDCYEKYLIVPKDKYNEALIEDEWNNLQHIFASILMNHTTQPIVVKKLSSHERKTRTQKALWEYNKILMDSHILRFIDDPELRKTIRSALNRGEGYHQLTGKIGSVHGSKFKGTTELELTIWIECSRLIANCIIYYNALILSKIYEAQEKLRNKEILEFIKRLSPIAWRHIILNGLYEFTSIPAGINLDEIIAHLIFDLKKMKGKSKARA